MSAIEGHPCGLMKTALKPLRHLPKYGDSFQTSPAGKIGMPGSRNEIHGPFAEGTTFSMQPPGEDALTSTLTEVKENETFADETICR